jgi:hypothetical protein
VSRSDLVDKIDETGCCDRLFGQVIVTCYLYRFGAWLMHLFMVHVVEVVGTGADPGFNATTTHQQNPNYDPFGNTCEADEVSPEVEAGVVAGLQCLQP